MAQKGKSLTTFFDVSKLVRQLSGLAGALRQQQKYAVGLNVGASSVKLCELKRTAKGYSLSHFGIADLPEDTLMNREIMNPVAVIDHIKRLASSMRLKSKTVCSSLSGSFVIVRNLSIEVQNMKDLRDQVFWEAEQYLPFDVTDVVMDFHSFSVINKKANVILVAVKKSIVETLMNCVTAANLKPSVIDIDFFALQHVFEANYPQSDEAVALVDIGASSMKVVVVYQGVPIFTKDAPPGGQQLTLEIAKSMNISFSDAEVLKMSSGLDGNMPADVSELIAIMAENFASELKKTLDFYTASSIGPAIAYILLSGGSARLQDLSQTIEDCTKVPTQMLNPFASLHIDSSKFTNDYLDSIAPLACVPVGLALRAGAE